MNPVDFQTKIQEDVRDIICDLNLYFENTQFELKTGHFTVFGKPSDVTLLNIRIDVMKKLSSLENRIANSNLQGWRPS